MLTWTLTIQVAATAVVLSIGGLLYARHIARAFDRKWGRPEDWG